MSKDTKEVKWIKFRTKPEMHKALKLASAESGESMQHHINIALAAHYLKESEVISYEA